MEIRKMLKIEYERKNRGWTQTDLAYHAKMSVPDISKIERGWMKPFNGMSQRLSEVLGIPAEELIKEVTEGK